LFLLAFVENWLPILPLLMKWTAERVLTAKWPLAAYSPFVRRALRRKANLTNFKVHNNILVVSGEGSLR
jgi:hypothetical protein